MVRRSHFVLFARCDTGQFENELVVLSFQNNGRVLTLNLKWWNQGYYSLVGKI